MATEYPISLTHLITDAMSIPFEFLTKSKITENQGWIAGKPEPDRGADILARSESTARHLSVEVMVCSAPVITSGGLEKYQFTISKTQIADFHLNSTKSYLICWMNYSPREPIAAIFPGSVIQDMTLKQRHHRKELKFHLYLDYEKRNCRFGIKEKTNEDGIDENDASGFLDNWNDKFSWEGKKMLRTMEEKRKRKMISSVSEMRTLFRVLIGDGWTANKVYPDMAGDIIAFNVKSGDFCSIQVKAARERKERKDGGETFHYSLSKSQQQKLIDDAKNSIYIFWIWDNNVEEPDDWTPIVISSDELRGNHKSAEKGNVSILRKDGQLFWSHFGATPAEKWVNDWSYFD